MRVGIVTPRFPPTISGGGEISVKLLVEQLVDRGHDVQVFSFDGGERTDVNGFNVHRFRGIPRGILEIANGYALFELWRARDSVASLDVMHAYSVTLNPAVGRVSSSLDVPSIATLNTYDLLPKAAFGVNANPPRRLYELLAMPTTGRFLRREVKRIDRFITLSHASRQVYRENSFDDICIDVVPNMVDPEFEPIDVTKSRQGYNLLFVGSLIKEKGVSYLVRALTELPADVSLRIVGSGKEEGSLRALAVNLGVRSRIEFRGRIPYEEVYREYSSADCFVHPGVWPEPFGRTILEAMQTGLPVVTTAVGGPAELVPQEELQCSPRDPDALADAIKISRTRPDVGEENREYVLKHFSPDTVVPQLCDVYDRAIVES